MMSIPNLASPKFQIRKDLDKQTRLRVAFFALFFNYYGLITRLSERYGVSRQFIYDLRNELSAACNAAEETSVSDKLSKKYQSIRYVLKFRLEGGCSLSGLSACLKEVGVSYHSVGFISESIQKIGAQLPSKISPSASGVQMVIYSSDEIYVQKTPILVTVDPESLSILKMEKAEDCQSARWLAHWQSIKDQAYSPSYVVKDEGAGMQGAISQLSPALAVQSDSFHAVAYKLGKIDFQLFEQALKAIEKEYKKEAYLAQSPNHCDRQEAYQEACQESQQAIAFYELYHWLYGQLRACLENFDRQGFYKPLDEVQADFGAALEMLGEIPLKKIQKAAKSILALKERLFYFKKVAQRVLDDLRKHFEEDVLVPLCAAWQFHKKQIKTKRFAYKQALKKKEQAILAEVAVFLSHQYRSTKEEVYAQLDTIVQSSASVETINSWLRPYLNTSKNQISQDFLNLLMFYHNHRRFRAGKRKGKTPMEILTGKKQEKDYVDLILERVKI